MGTVYTPNTALIEVNMLTNGEHAQNTFYVEGLTPMGTADLEELCTQVEAWWKLYAIQEYTTKTELVSISAKAQDSATAPVWEISVTASNVGTLVADAAPNNVAFCLSFLTALGGRSYRGRNYICGIPITVISGNAITSAYANAWITNYETLLSELAILNRTMVVVSKYSGVNPTTGKPIPRVSGITTPITGFKWVNLDLDSQRRRLPGRGS